VGCLLTVKKEETHKSLLVRRGFISGENSEQKEKDETKIKSFDRVRMIQDEMIRLAEESNWLLIEQKVEKDPLDFVAEKLSRDAEAEELHMKHLFEHATHKDTDVVNDLPAEHSAHYISTDSNGAS
jgi:2-phosphoglycerate kinase